MSQTKPPPSAQDARMMEPGVHIRQSRQARFHDIISPVPAVIWVLQGKKLVSTDREHREVQSGFMVLLPENRPITVENIPIGDCPYEARVLAFDRTVFEDVYQRLDLTEDHRRRTFAAAQCTPELDAAFRRAREALSAGDGLPEDIRRHRCEEIVLWLAERGACLPWAGPAAMSDRVRAIIAANPGHPWTSAELGRRLAVSEATLRRRLSAEGTSFKHVLTEMRMLAALSLLQTTTWRVSAIAKTVGYASTPRFIKRFHARYGLHPLDIRRREHSLGAVPQSITKEG